jgi:hypothetical protein
MMNHRIGGDNSSKGIHRAWLPAFGEVFFVHSVFSWQYPYQIPADF